MQGSVRAPEILRSGIEWFNVARPLSLQSLRGKVVILDFWTFCCINCMQILPSLRKVEEAFPEEVAVIGVHSPKFTAEHDGRTVAHAIARYGITHPVAHDPEFQLWKSFAVRAWPTLVFIAPDGSVVGQHSGEPDPEKLLQAVREMIERARNGGQLKPSPLPLAGTSTADGALAFPGKMKPLATSTRLQRWAITDGGHHQIVMLSEKGREAGRIGSGALGFDDGNLRTATFNRPQGLICAADVIYVADTGNHAIRKIDLAAGRVTTLAGMGRRGGALPQAAPSLETALASPWDLELDGDTLYFANAGTHQLGRIDLANGTARALAGDGGEAIEDGPAAQARLAQPSGLALSPDRSVLYFVDSETSSVRALRSGDAPAVQTLVGTGLFDFGHQNGDFVEARFQHPLGLCFADGTLLVADSYNGVIRALDLETRRVSDFDDNEFFCADPVCLPAGEPAGVTADAENVYMVDTNNHRIVAYEPRERRYRTWFA
ncbi:MAG TPA: thioredoxin-like domain-containing protein [Candidatus Cybelea sp.]|nr:thioredoxin-like domain-containing protein [Candidatus Cybelea sp.]